MFTYHGIEAYQPEGWNPKPTIEYSIVPVQRMPFELWGELVRAELKSRVLRCPIEERFADLDCVLVKKYTL